MSYTVETGVIAVVDALGVRESSARDPTGFLDKRDGLLSKVDKMKVRLAKLPSKLKPPEIVLLGDTFIFDWPAKDPLEVLYSAGIFLVSFVHFGLLDGFCFRGAVAVGDYVRDPKSVVGAAVTDAISWCDQADWMGIVVTPHFGLRLSLIANKSNATEEEKDIITLHHTEYEVPVKNGGKIRLWAVSWPLSFFVAGNNDARQAREQFLSCLESQRIPLGTERKLWNTMAFFEHVTKQLEKNPP